MIVFLRFSARSSRRFDFSNGVHSVTVSNWIIIITIIGTVDEERCKVQRIPDFIAIMIESIFMRYTPLIVYSWKMNQRLNS